MNRHFRFSGIACIACVILTAIALLLLTSSARAQLRADGVAAVRLGMSRTQIDSVVKADEWQVATLAYDPNSPTIDLLPDPSAPRAHPVIACDSGNGSPSDCIYIDRVLLSIVPTRSGNSTTPSITVRTRAYGTTSKRIASDVALLYRTLYNLMCPGSVPCPAASVPKAAKLRSFLTSPRGSDTLVAGTWNWQNNTGALLSQTKLLLVRDKAAKLVWYEVVYEDLRKR